MRGRGMGFLYLTSIRVSRQLGSGNNCGKSGLARAAATIINGMKPHAIGRALGIGLRVAGRIAGQRMTAGAQAAASAPATQSAAEASAHGRAAGQVTRGVARGVRGFLRPFRRVGGILWLEVTGVFFFLFVLVFGMALWRTRPNQLNGPYDKTFLASAALLLVFLYLGISSFWRARRK